HLRAGLRCARSRPTRADSVATGVAALEAVYSLRRIDMPSNNNIQTVILMVRLGNAPSFDMHADEDPTATPSGCRYSGSGTGPGDLDFLLEILHKLELAYGNSPAVSLCLNGLTIKRD